MRASAREQRGGRGPGEHLWDWVLPASQRLPRSLQGSWHFNPFFIRGWRCWLCGQRRLALLMENAGHCGPRCLRSCWASVSTRLLASLHLSGSLVCPEDCQRRCPGGRGQAGEVGGVVGGG